tara:strand:- start:988 stop:1905 length:918 start_codon:yes stop_codon:yes gene_type:complete
MITLFVVSCKNSRKKDLITLPVQTFLSGGLEREYMLYIPQSAEKNSPLVFMLHGLGSTHTIIMNYSQMNQVADKHGFVVCYPQGIRGAENTRHTKKGTPFWNVGYETHKNETVDDVSFIKSLAIYLQQEYNLDPEKTFCAGMSNGGDMSYLLGCEAPDIFKAIAPITGCMMGWIYDSCNKNDPVPVFQVHGTADKTTYYDGDVDNRDKWGVYMGVETTINFWVDRNECKEINIDTLPDIDRNDGSIVITEKYTGGRNNNEVWFYKVINGDHEWPPGWPVKSGNGDLNTSEEIWKFFQHFINQRES